MSRFRQSLLIDFLINKKIMWSAEFLYFVSEKQHFRRRRRKSQRLLSSLCLGEVNESQSGSYLGCCFPLGARVEIVHALRLCCFMKQAVPICSCKQVKTNRIYCKHFWKQAGNLSAPAVYSELESIAVLTNAVRIQFSLNMADPRTACSLSGPR